MPLPPPKKVDQVFQLSLTEVAFTLIFLLLLLVGIVMIRLNRMTDAQARSVALKSEAEDAVVKKAAAEKVLSEMRRLLEDKAVSDPDALISELKRSIDRQSQQIKLNQEIKDLNSKISALKEVEKVIEEAKSAKATEEVARQIDSALALKTLLEAEIGEKISPGKEADIAKLVAQQIKKSKAVGTEGEPTWKLAKENRDLHGQVKWLTGRLNARGGRDYPPCWADPKTGKIQYLLRIQIKKGGFLVEKAWPAEREADAEHIPGITRLVCNDVQPLSLFRENVEELDAECKTKKCRHYVFLENHVSDLDVFNRYRYGVEDYFYKYEVRR